MRHKHAYRSLGRDETEWLGKEACSEECHMVLQHYRKDVVCSTTKTEIICQIHSYTHVHTHTYTDKERERDHNKDCDIKQWTLHMNPSIKLITPKCIYFSFSKKSASIAYMVHIGITLILFHVYKELLKKKKL